MLKISQAQRKSFESTSALKFEQSISAYLKSLAPEHTKAKGDESLLSFIRSARKRALTFNITQTDTTRVWLELSMFLGIDFPNDPQFYFAKEILEQEEDELLRMRRLHRKAYKFILSSNGPSSSSFHSALKRAASFDFSNKLEQGTSNDSDIVYLLRDLWPEKFKMVGVTNMQEFVEACRINAKAQRLDAGAGHIILSILSFFMGVGCTTDPQYPWLSKSIEVSGQKAVEKLYKRSHIYLKVVLDNAKL